MNERWERMASGSSKLCIDTSLLGRRGCCDFITQQDILLFSCRNFVFRYNFNKTYLERYGKSITESMQVLSLTHVLVSLFPSLCYRPILFQTPLCAQPILENNTITVLILYQYQYILALAIFSCSTPFSSTNRITFSSSHMSSNFKQQNTDHDVCTGKQN